jgi:nucleoside-diphosphate-sugar epimerase
MKEFLSEKGIDFTGVAGFIGHRLALQLLEDEDVEVTGFRFNNRLLCC